MGLRYTVKQQSILSVVSLDDKPDYKKSFKGYLVWLYANFENIANTKHESFVYAEIENVNNNGYMNFDEYFMVTEALYKIGYSAVDNPNAEDTLEAIEAYLFNNGLIVEK